MKKTGPVIGMVAAGGVTRSFLARMPVLMARMGPVKAASFQVARRTANTLHAGHAVTNYAALAECDLIFIAVPDTGIDKVSRELATGTALAGKVAILCGSARDSFWPSPLLAGGARVATLNCVDESGEQVFVAEGDPAAMRELRRMIDAEHRKLIELRAASKALYLSGIHLAAHLLLPWFSASVESLRNAGLTRIEATHVAYSLACKALRGYAKAGAKAWSPAAAEQLETSLKADLDTIRGVDPRLAALYADGVEQALRYFSAGRFGSDGPP